MSGLRGEPVSGGRGFGRGGDGFFAGSAPADGAGGESGHVQGRAGGSAGICGSGSDRERRGAGGGADREGDRGLGGGGAGESGESVSPPQASGRDSIVVCFLRRDRGSDGSLGGGGPEGEADRREREDAGSQVGVCLYSDGGGRGGLAGAGRSQHQFCGSDRGVRVVRGADARGGGAAGVGAGGEGGGDRGRGEVDLGVGGVALPRSGGDRGPLSCAPAPASSVRPVEPTGGGDGGEVGNPLAHGAGRGEGGEDFGGSGSPAGPEWSAAEGGEDRAGVFPDQRGADGLRRVPGAGTVCGFGGGGGGVQDGDREAAEAVGDGVDGGGSQCDPGATLLLCLRADRGILGTTGRLKPHFMSQAHRIFPAMEFQANGNESRTHQQ